MATAFQIKKIHILKTKLELSEARYRELLRSFNAQSSKQLAYGDAVILIDILAQDAIDKDLWVEKMKKYAELKRSGNMATSAQLRMIEGLWWEIAYEKNDVSTKKSLKLFLYKKLKIEDILLLSKTQANKAIQIISAIKKNKDTRAETLVDSN